MYRSPCQHDCPLLNGANLKCSLFQSACVCQGSLFSGLYLLLIQTLCVTSAALKSICGFLLLMLQYDTLTKATEEGKGFLACSSRAQSIMAGKLKQLVTWHPQPRSGEMNE